MLWCVSAVLLSPQMATAHFPWIAVDDGHAVMFFGESPADRAYKTPQCVAEATLQQVAADGATTAVEHAQVETHQFIGRKSSDKIDAAQPLVMSCEYGVYHGTLLTYTACYLPPGAKSGDHQFMGSLNATVEPTEGGLNVVVLHEGQPLAGAKVTLVDAAGQTANSATNNAGKATFRSFKPGLLGLTIGHSTEATGESGDQKYTTKSHYLTLAVPYESSTGNNSSAATMPALPTPIASFGATVCDGYLYVYSGHTGTAHAHSRDNLSPHFVRCKIDGGASWESLSLPQPLQGLAIVSHGGKVYRVGGLDARNASGDDEDLHSVASFAEYDPQSNTWRDLPAMPQPRSSHNAVVIGDKLYVAGGWTLTGDSAGEWQDNVLCYDLSKSDAQWQELPQPPFKRRALAVAAAGGRLVVLGGMDDVADVCADVFVFDPANNSWSEAPKFPGEQMNSFGMAAWGLGDTVVASGMNGKLYRWQVASDKWEQVAELSTPRFFHQLLPVADNKLVAIAGASPEEGHVATLEVLEVKAAE
jgi:N-acetylneuraminic acid mutarotase